MKLSLFLLALVGLLAATAATMDSSNAAEGAHALTMVKNYMLNHLSPLLHERRDQLKARRDEEESDYDRCMNVEYSSVASACEACTAEPGCSWEGFFCTPTKEENDGNFEADEEGNSCSWNSVESCSIGCSTTTSEYNVTMDKEAYTDEDGVEHGAVVGGDFSFTRVHFTMGPNFMLEMFAIALGATPSTSFPAIEITMIGARSIHGGSGAGMIMMQARITSQDFVDQSGQIHLSMWYMVQTYKYNGLDTTSEFTVDNENSLTPSFNSTRQYTLGEVPTSSYPTSADGRTHFTLSSSEHTVDCHFSHEGIKGVAMDTTPYHVKCDVITDADLAADEGIAFKSLYVGLDAAIFTTAENQSKVGKYTSGSFFLEYADTATDHNTGASVSVVNTALSLIEEDPQIAMYIDGVTVGEGEVEVVAHTVYSKMPVGVGNFTWDPELALDPNSFDKEKAEESSASPLSISLSAALIFAVVGVFIF